MAKVYVTRRETFSSAHRLHSKALSDEENRKVSTGEDSPTQRIGYLFVSEVVVAEYCKHLLLKASPHAADPRKIMCGSKIAVVRQQCLRGGTTEKT